MALLLDLGSSGSSAASSSRGKPQLASRHEHGRTGDGHGVDLLLTAERSRAQHRRAADLPSLKDLDLLPEYHTAVAAQMQGQWTRRRSRRRVLRHAAERREHAILSTPAGWRVAAEL